MSNEDRGELEEDERVVGVLAQESARLLRESRGLHRFFVSHGIEKALVKKATIGDLDTLFHDILRQVQIRFPATLPAHLKIDDEYSVRRSLRRGSTSDAHNQHIPKEVIEANNRWRKHMRSRNVLPSMDMVERYSDAKATVIALVRYSEMLY